MGQPYASASVSENERFGVQQINPNDQFFMFCKHLKKNISFPTRIACSFKNLFLRPLHIDFQQNYSMMLEELTSISLCLEHLKLF